MIFTPRYLEKVRWIKKMSGNLWLFRFFLCENIRYSIALLQWISIYLKIIVDISKSVQNRRRKLAEFYGMSQLSYHLLRLSMA